MNIRTVSGFLTGVVLWWFLFFAIGIGTGMLWPDYREAARFMFREQDLSHFTLAMLCLNLVIFTVEGLITGWLTTFISRSRTPSLIVGLLFLLHMGVNHYYMVWGKLPDWYNIIVPLFISGSIALGGRLVKAGPPANK